MLFAHDTEVALVSAAALVNADLPDIDAVDEFFAAYDWAGTWSRTKTELKAVQELRPRLRELWDADEDRIVEIVNSLLLEYRALPQLVKHDHWPYHLHAVPSDSPLSARMAVEAAMAFVDVVRSGEVSRLRICELGDCGNVLVDLSKNRSKRFCDTGCGNRAAVSAYRARKAARK
ncbi:CGNR zinc finger domain-containing protein [Catelliglobosispora koreensis]|uniref:CGNR zinc finger domain-containing protein n=1 Tax=Catelliglobosispora koreensis TaxID=129052 RepID=UPI00039E93DA|nr:CGNR zinc finger domain-containing protein [Catelliglobosispora koreensis]